MFSALDNSDDDDREGIPDNLASQQENVQEEGDQINPDFEQNEDNNEDNWNTYHSKDIKKKKRHTHSNAEIREVCLKLLGSFPRRQLMIVLCGIPGSGKSTFCHSLYASQSETTRLKWSASNQDTLKSRGATLEHATAAIYAGMNVIIDRCNFDSSQRIHWIKLARECEENLKTKILKIAIIMPDSVNTSLCIDRATKRGDSDGVHDIDTDWNKVCNIMSTNFIPPAMNEGFDALFPCDSSSDLEEIQDYFVER